MSTYYRYVNHTRGEFVDPGDVLPGVGFGEDAVVRCGGALAYLMFPPPTPPQPDCEFRGRWGSLPLYLDAPDGEPGSMVDLARTAGAAQAVAVVADSDVDFDDLGYVDISDALIAEMRREGAWRDVERPPARAPLEERA